MAVGKLNSTDGLPCMGGGKLNSTDGLPCMGGGKLDSTDGLPCMGGGKLDSTNGLPCMEGAVDQLMGCHVCRGELDSTDGLPYMAGGQLNSANALGGVKGGGLRPAGVPGDGGGGQLKSTGGRAQRAVAWRRRAMGVSAAGMADGNGRRGIAGRKQARRGFWKWFIPIIPTPLILSPQARRGATPLMVLNEHFLPRFEGGFRAEREAKAAARGLGVTS